MVSVFLEAVPANMLVARAVCNDNRDTNAHYTCFGMMIRIRGDNRLVLKRGVIEEAIGRGLTENEWRSVTWLYIGSISKFEENEAVFEDSEESKVVDRYWDDQLEKADGEAQVLAFVGAPAAGKTEAASVAVEMGIPVITMGDVIRGELRRRGLPLSDENAGRIANELRAREGMDAIAKRCIPLIKRIIGREERKAKKVIVIDGIRGIAEVEAFKKEFDTDFVLVRIEAPRILRYERIKTRDRDDDLLSIEEFEAREERENQWGMGEAMKRADRVVKNEGSLEEFKEEIKRILEFKD